MPVTRSQYFSCFASTGDVSLAFGLNASWVRVYLDTSGPLYLNFGSTLGTTQGIPMSSGDSPQTFVDGLMGGMGLKTTNTDASITGRVFALSQ